VINYWRLQSSNARTKSVGVLEREEGLVILDEIGEILQLYKEEKSEITNLFIKRCESWLKQKKRKKYENDK
jgi:hypothetical protein